MPRRTVFLLAVILTVTSTSLAADKILSTLEQPEGTTGVAPPPLAGPLSTAWIPGTSKGTLKHIACKFQVKLSHTNLGTGDGTPGTGDEVICLGDANIAYEGANLPTTAVFRGERNAGAVSIKLDLAQETTGPGSCGVVDDLVVYDARLTVLRARSVVCPHLQPGVQLRSDPGGRGRGLCAAANEPADRHAGGPDPLSHRQLSVS